MRTVLTRRDFSQTIGLGAAAAALSGAPARKLKIGYTCIIWGTFPRGAEAFATLEPALKDVGSLGYYASRRFPKCSRTGTSAAR
jgi:inosose dehydratase